MIMIPTEMLVFLGLLLVLLILGWGWTIGASMRRGLEMHKMGDAAGYSRGCLATLEQVRRPAKKKKWRILPKTTRIQNQ